MTAYAYTADGGLVLGGAAPSRSSAGSQSLTFTWNVGPIPELFYRVTSSCRSGSSTTPCPSMQPGCQTMLIVNVYAKDVAEVCQKIAAMNLGVPIKKIEQYTNPANKSNWSSSSACNSLKDVTPPPSFPACQDVLESFPGIVPLGMRMVYQAAFLIEASGSIGFSGHNNFEYQTFTLSGSADFVSNHIFYDASGSLVLTGLSTAKSGVITSGQGGLTLSGSIVFTVDQNSGGNLGLSGSAATSATYIYGLGQGGLAISGGNDAFSSDIQPQGGFTFSGQADAQCSDAGTALMALGAKFTVPFQQAVFAFESGASVAAYTTRIVKRCCTLGIPPFLTVGHQLASADIFKQFLQRNGAFIDSPSEIYYHSADDGWHNTIHYQGYGSDSKTTETWAITFGWECVNGSAAQALAGSGGTYWKFSMLVALRQPNLPLRITRLIAGFDASRICFSNNTLNFFFDFDTQAQTTTPSAVQTLVFADDIGLYKSAAFVASPLIRFKISEAVVDIAPGEVDIGPPVAAASLVGTTIALG